MTDDRFVKDFLVLAKLVTKEAGAYDFVGDRLFVRGPCKPGCPVCEGGHCRIYEIPKGLKYYAYKARYAVHKVEATR